MTDSATPPPPSDRDQMPRHTTPTWEVELLISGVAVFAMLQLPGWLDDRLLMWRPRFEADWGELLLIIGLYLKGVAVILSVTFALHLLLRAQWIALVGMHSVFPDGIRWERLRMGPVRRETEQGMQCSTDASIDRADNRATVVFAIGVMLATMLLMLCVFAGLSMGLIISVANLTGLPVSPSGGLMLLVAILLGPFLVCNILDRRFGAHLQRGSRLHRIMQSVFRRTARLGIGSGSEVMQLLTSNSGMWRMTALTGITFVVVLLGSVWGSIALREPQLIGNYALFPRATDDGHRAINAASYDDLRHPESDKPLPYIQSIVIDGAYLRLVVPWQPVIDNPAVRKNCPNAFAMKEDTRTQATLDCMQRLHAVTLDGKPVANLRYDISSDPRTQRPALQAMIDVRTLPQGHHELRVMHAPGDRHDHGRIGQYVIPFWR